MFDETVTRSEAETAQFAGRFAHTLKNRDIVVFHGDLGLGKSVFARAIIRALLNDPNLNVPSPTFTLVQTYDAPDFPIWHYDLYRLKDPEEMYELSWDDALSHGIVLVEWPDRLQDLHPKRYFDVTISPVSGEPDARAIKVEFHED